MDNTAVVPPKRGRKRLLRCALAFLCAPVLTWGVAVPAAQAAPLPGGLGPCLPGNCPDPYPPVNNGAFAGRDANINIFTGGDFRVRERAAEAEGKVVSLGDFDMNKSAGGSQVYNVGIVGVGSRVPPPDGSDFLTTGGGVSVAPGQRLLAEGGVVRHAGPASGTIVDRPVQDPDAAEPYRKLRGELVDASHCYAQGDTGTRPATGTAVNNGYETVFTGDGSSSLQVFNVDFDLQSASGGQQGIRFANIPADATVLVNMTGEARTINTYSGQLDDNDPFNQLRERLLWNFPDASRIGLIGTGQFQGSILAGNPQSEMTVTLPGTNGRLYTAGSLTHTSAASGGGGQEIHAYPFDGDLPDCAEPTPQSGVLTVEKQDSEDQVPLPGAEFQLWRETNGVDGLQTGGENPDATVGEPCTTGAEGTCEQSVTEPGTYYWQETAAPEGYDLPENPVVGPVEVTAENISQGSRVEADNTRSAEPDNTVRVEKRDAEDGSPLPGAEFQLWRETNGTAGLQTGGENPDTAVGDRCTTDGEGVCAETVTSTGTYYWEETAVPEGYEMPADTVIGPVEVTEPGQTYEVTADNQKTPEPGPDPDPDPDPDPNNEDGPLRIDKRDGESGARLPGAEFQLWRETNGVEGLQTGGGNPDTTVGEPCTTGALGRCERTVSEPGAYYWQETAAPEGYDLPENPVTGPVEVTAENIGRGQTSEADNARSQDPDSTVRIEKRDKESGARLPGAEFQLWRETNGTAGLQTGGENPDTAVGGPCTTGGRGVCEETVTSTGTYYWEETAAPDGYELPRDTVTGPVEVTEPGQTYRVTADNRKTPDPGPGPDPKGDIRLDKTDRKNGEPLPGAVFQLWRETNGTAGLQTGGGDPDTRTGSACATDDKGRCSFDELPLGTYYLEETAVPEGYELPADPVSGPYELTAGNAGKGLTVPLENTRGEPGKGEGKGDNGGK